MCKNFWNKKEFKIQKNGKYFSDHVIGLPNHKKISKTYMNKIGYTIKKFYEKKYSENIYLIFLFLFAFIFNFYVASKGVLPIDTFLHYDSASRILNVLYQ